MQNKQPSEDIKPGTKLTAQQTEQLNQELGQVISRIAHRRKHLLLIHDSLQNTIGMFFQFLGWRVEYEVPFHSGEWDAERTVFDIVATQDENTAVIEVKDVVTSRDLGQVYGYANTLQLAKIKAKIFLGTDILNWDNLLVGVIGETVKELIERESMGVILADKYLLIICDNYLQLALREMPQIVPSVQPIG